MGLKEYKRKRDFRRTPEPSGRVQRRKQQGLQFVIQKHAASRLHYDFRLELDGVLKSWAVPKGPSLDPRVKRLAVHVEDHPIEYGSFEGVIPEDEYGGGTVLLWDAGEWIPEGDTRADYRRGRLKFRLEGEKLRGNWTLVRTGGANNKDGKNWLLIKVRDAEASTGEDITELRPESVASGRALEAITADADRVWHSNKPARKSRRFSRARTAGAPAKRAAARKKRAPTSALSLAGARGAPLPKTFAPQLATLVSEAPEGDDWLHEIKLDGYRIICFVDHGRARCISRNGLDWTARYGEIVQALGELPCETALLDGEAVVLDANGISRFQALQNALSLPVARRQIHFFAFDLMHLDGIDLTGVAQLERKELLRTLISSGNDAVLRFSDHVVGEGPAFHGRACAAGVEGIVSKRAASPYRQGRSRDWLKTKCVLRQEFVIVGFTEPKGSRSAFGALLIAVHDDAKRLIYAGRVGTGFTDRTLRELYRRLKKLERSRPAIVDPPRGAAVRDVHWVEPELVAEVAFTEWTSDGLIRHPSFQGLREDKSASDVVRETNTEQPGFTQRTPKKQREQKVDGQRNGMNGGKERNGKKEWNETKGKSGKKERRGSGGIVEVEGIRLSNPDKVLYPEQGITKQTLAEYYAAVSEHMLPHVVDRPLTLVRCPEGRDKQCFYQKHANESMPDIIRRVTIKEENGNADLYLAIDDVAALIALVQLGVLEFHLWGCRTDKLDRPDLLIFDLDPDTALPWKEVRDAALLLRELLQQLELQSFVKSTGGKGLHVVIPIGRRTSWDDAKSFTRAVAEVFVKEWPDRFTATMSKKQRTGKIFIDYLRNAPNATAIAPYSTRARPGAPVAAPLHWNELTDSRQRPEYTIETMPRRLERLKHDPWEGFFGLRQTINKAMIRKTLG